MEQRAERFSATGKSAPAFRLFFLTGSNYPERLCTREIWGDPLFSRNKNDGAFMFKCL